MTIKVLISTIDSPLAKEIAKGFLAKGISVLGFGMQESSLGSLRLSENFSFQKVDLLKHSIVRSWLYGVSDILFIESDKAFNQKVDKVYQEVLHLRSKIPRIIMLSSAEIFRHMGTGPFLEKAEILDTEDMHQLRGAEIMLNNYSGHLDTPSCVLRLPLILGDGFTPKIYKPWFSYLRRQKSIQIQPNDRYFQFVTIYQIIESLSTLLNAKWSGFEIFHTASYTKPLNEALADFLAVLNPNCQIIEELSFLDKIKLKLSQFQEIRKILLSNYLIYDDSFLDSPILDTKDSDRLFKPKPINLKTFKFS